MTSANRRRQRLSYAKVGRVIRLLSASLIRDPALERKARAALRIHPLGLAEDG